MDGKVYAVVKKLALALFFAFLTVVVMYAFRIVFKTYEFIADVGGVSAFASVFGTLYGIIIAFVIFEVWVQFNRLSSLVDREALGIEKLYRLALYFNDKKISLQMKKAVEKYAKVVIKGNFQKLAAGERNKESSKVFREIYSVIRGIKISNAREQTVFRHLIDHYDQLSETRTERINQALTRLPALLKVFLYSASIFTLFIFIVLPFANPFYGFITTGTLGFVIAMVFMIIEDLDNPFKGFWKITPEAFERALKHIEEDY